MVLVVVQRFSKDNWSLNRCIIIAAKIIKNENISSTFIVRSTNFSTDKMSLVLRMVIGGVYLIRM